MDEYIGTIKAFGFNFAPRGWALCNGATLPIAQNTALFSLLGTFYGGNGQTTFQLPDLQGRVAIGMGNGAGLSPYAIGQRAGTENTTLTTSNLPAHTHPFAVKAYSEAGNVSDPTNASPANTGSLDSEYRTSGTAVNMASQTTGVSGSSQPFSILEPYLVINYSICLEGIYPSRS